MAHPTETGLRPTARLRAAVLDNIGFNLLAIALSLVAYAMTHRPAAPQPPPETPPPACP